MKPPAAGIAPSADTPVSALRGPVLVLDSDPAVRRVLRLVLEGAGFRCIGCAAVHDVPGLIETHQPSLILAEASFAAESGAELEGHLASLNGRRPKLAIMSAYPRQRRGYEDYFVPKPVEFDRLLHLLEGLERGA